MKTTIKLMTVSELDKTVRKRWIINPGTKTFKTKKDYNRHTDKKLVERNFRGDMD